MREHIPAAQRLGTKSMNNSSSNIGATGLFDSGSQTSGLFQNELAKQISAKIYGSAIFYLSRREHSVKELEQKLTTKFKNPYSLSTKLRTRRNKGRGKKTGFGKSRGYSQTKNRSQAKTRSQEEGRSWGSQRQTSSEWSNEVEDEIDLKPSSVEDQSGNHPTYLDVTAEANITDEPDVGSPSGDSVEEDAIDLAQIVSHTIARLLEEKLLSDERYAEMVLNSRMNRGYGPIYINQALRAKGVPEQITEILFEELAPDWEDVARQAITRKFAGHETSYELWGKAARFLQRRGFSSSTVRSALGDMPARDYS